MAPRKRPEPKPAADPRLGGTPPFSPLVGVGIEEADRPKSSVRLWHLLLGFAALCFVAFEVYGPALNGEFLFDDPYLPFLVPSVAEAPLRAWLGVRPFLMLSYWVNYKTSGLDPYAYHAVNVVLHIFNSILAAVIVRRLLEIAGETVAWRRNLLAGFAGGLFLLHPVQTESVAYVVGRSETMSIFFFLSAFAVFICRRDREVGVLRAVGVLLLFGIACTVKEHTVVLPALLLLTDYYFNPGFSFDGIRRNAKLYLPIFAIGAVGAFAVFKVLSSSLSAGFGLRDFTWYQYLFTQFRVIWLYLRLFVAPVHQNGDYAMHVSRNLFDGGAIFGLIALLGAAAAAWHFRRKYPLASYGFFGFLILLAPTSSVVPIQDVAVERRLYLPFVCLLLMAVDFLRRWRAPQMTMAVTMGALLTVTGVLAYQRNQVWSNNLTFWQDVLQKSPHNSRAAFQLAYSQWQAGQCAEAVVSYEKAATMQKHDDRLLIDWALALDCANRLDEAMTKLQQAAKQGAAAHSYALAGMMYGKRRRGAEALEALAKAEAANPRFEMTYVYRGNIYADQGAYSDALAQYRIALGMNPYNQAAQEAIAAVERQARP